jgi:amino acid adenylation domain-containing protein
MAGIVEADGVYVPLDVKSPGERLRKIAADCTPAAALCDASTFARVRDQLPSAPLVICLSSREAMPATERAAWLFSEDLAGLPENPPPCGNTAEDVAYVLYTSGSTGNPKGVMITHRNIRNYIDWAVQCFSLSEEDRVLGTAPFHFDMSTFDIWGTLASGGTLCLAGDGLTLFPERLLRFMEEEKVTIWKGISSLLMYLARTGVLREGRLPDLSRVLFGGEALPTRYLMTWMEKFPEKAFYNVYGPTEATGISMYQLILRRPERPDEKVPIGSPCRGARVYLLDEGLKPVKEGEIGELFIAGPGVGAGYLNDPEKTARSFLPNPISGDPADRCYRTGDLALLREHGEYEFAGRRDHQVKMMGYRIELSEIEHHLLSVEGVRDGVVVCAPTPEGIQELVAFMEAEETVAVPELLARMKECLPAYMVPRRLIRIETIPRGDRGKVDRGSLLRLLGRASP